MLRLLGFIVATPSIVLLSGCPTAPATSDGDGEDGGFPSDAGEAGADGDSADAGDDGQEDGFAVFEGPGPLTFIGAESEVLLDRACDLDGDGASDNAIADLGSPNAELLAITLTTNLQGSLRLAVHFPWVDDRARMEDLDAPAILFVGRDLDDPVFPDDDLSGEEPFYVEGQNLDPCGEPLYACPTTRLTSGTIAAEGCNIPIPVSTGPPVGRLGRIWGTVEPGGAGLSATACYAGTIRDIGSSRGFRNTEGLTMLEIVVAGGAALGLPQLPGIEPDLDLDGDGLERLEQDPITLHLTGCVDGDSSWIAGRDCYLDPRMADAYSWVVSLDMVPALFAGREPDWERWFDEPCDDPPERSLFDAP